jgi:hypothetical protein
VNAYCVSKLFGDSWLHSSQQPDPLSVEMELMGRDLLPSHWPSIPLKGFWWRQIFVKHGTIIIDGMIRLRNNFSIVCLKLIPVFILLDSCSTVKKKKALAYVSTSCGNGALTRTASQPLKKILFVVWHPTFPADPEVAKQWRAFSKSGNKELGNKSSSVVFVAFFRNVIFGYSENTVAQEIYHSSVPQFRRENRR